MRFHSPALHAHLARRSHAFALMHTSDSPCLPATFFRTVLVCGSASTLRYIQLLSPGCLRFFVMATQKSFLAAGTRKSLPCSLHLSRCHSSFWPLRVALPSYDLHWPSLTSSSQSLQLPAANCTNIVWTFAWLTPSGRDLICMSRLLLTALQPRPIRLCVLARFSQDLSLCHLCEFRMKISHLH